MPRSKIDKETRQQEENDFETNVAKSTLSILHSIKSNIPLDLTFLKQMHKIDQHHLEKIIKTKANINDESEDVPFYEYMSAINNSLNKINLNLVAIYEFDTIQTFNRKMEQHEEVAILAGFYVKNLIGDSNCINENLVKLKKLAKKKNYDPCLYEDIYSKMFNEIEILKNCHLIGQDPSADMNKFLIQIILTFIVTRSFELGSDQGQFWNSEDPLKSFTTLRDIYHFLNETFGLNVPSDTDKDGGYDIRFNSGKISIAGNIKEKGYIKNLITIIMKKHRYIKLNACENIRDSMLYEGDNENGKIQVMWDVKAVAEYDIIELLKSFTVMLCKEPISEWENDKAFNSGIMAFKERCDLIKKYPENDDVFTILRNL